MEANSSGMGSSEAKYSPAVQIAGSLAFEPVSPYAAAQAPRYKKPNAGGIRLDRASIPATEFVEQDYRQIKPATHHFDNFFSYFRIYTQWFIFKLRFGLSWKCVIWFWVRGSSLGEGVKLKESDFLTQLALSINSNAINLCFSDTIWRRCHWGGLAVLLKKPSGSEKAAIAIVRLSESWFWAEVQNLRT